ncbi:hypothetical protein [Rheinheimera soli]|uniref:Uncharacterized protein n=1 Tax=Rheinheimera soli TaxID=443616 RepID=A0ABU1VYC5_9GAMM|nr:hypothetical protein [Rheinheimera soli]MDR7120468.1 hypothetical protein [Rheinheimera soli]
MPDNTILVCADPNSNKAINLTPNDFKQAVEVEFIIVIMKYGPQNQTKSVAENNRYLRKFLSDFAFFAKKIRLLNKGGSSGAVRGKPSKAIGLFCIKKRHLGAVFSAGYYFC